MKNCEPFVFKDRTYMESSNHNITPVFHYTIRLPLGGQSDMLPKYCQSISDYGTDTYRFSTFGELTDKQLIEIQKSCGADAIIVPDTIGATPITKSYYLYNVEWSSRNRSTKSYDWMSCPMEGRSGVVIDLIFELFRPVGANIRGGLYVDSKMDLSKSNWSVIMDRKLSDVEISEGEAELAMLSADSLVGIRLQSSVSASHFKLRMLDPDCNGCCACSGINIAIPILPLVPAFQEPKRDSENTDWYDDSLSKQFNDYILSLGIKGKCVGINVVEPNGKRLVVR
jgi:hypothetical protein